MLRFPSLNRAPRCKSVYVRAANQTLVTSRSLSHLLMWDVIALARDVQPFSI